MKGNVKVYIYVMFSLFFTVAVAGCLEHPDGLLDFDFPSFDAGFEDGGVTDGDGGTVSSSDIADRMMDPSFYEEEYEAVEETLGRPCKRAKHYQVTYKEMKRAKKAHTWGNADWGVVVIPEVPPLGKCSCIDPEFRYHHPAPYSCWTWTGAAIREILQQERLEGEELQQATEEAATYHSCGAYNSRS